MFQVGRFDPDAASSNISGKQKKKRKRGAAAGRSGCSKKGDDETAPQQEFLNDDNAISHPKPARLRVIAEEQQEPARPSKSLRSAEEAFDDLDLLEELIEEGPHHDRSTCTAIITVGDSRKDPRAAAVLEEDDAAAAAVLEEDDMRRTILAAQRIAQMPIDEAAKGWKMAPFLLDNLKRHNFEHFFPIQALAIPDVLASERHAHLRARDVCITAPTGSGKTLSYVLPILNALAQQQQQQQQQQQHRLRALVVLPSRDLASQVYKVFLDYVAGSNFTVGLAIGQSDFVAEQKGLTVPMDGKADDSIDMLLNRLSYDPGNLSLAMQVNQRQRRRQLQQQQQQQSATGASRKMRVPAGGWSNVDILVCTPGRLVDHLDKTVGFTLQHLRFLVVDEADRLLSQSYHNWIDRVLEATNGASVAAWKNITATTTTTTKNPGASTVPVFQMAPNGQSVRIEPITWRRGGVEGDRSNQFNTNVGSSTAALVCRPIQLRKFLVSATLTRDPQKLAALHLVNPKHFNVHSMKGDGDKKYAMPAALTEYLVECSAEQKPLVLLSLLLEFLQRNQNQQSKREKTVIVVFTASLDSTHRLARLLQLLWAANQYGDNAVGEFSSSLSQNQRTALVQSCNNVQDPLSIVVCSDGMSRGYVSGTDLELKKPRIRVAAFCGSCSLKVPF